MLMTYVYISVPRRRRPKVELIEHVYALPSACEPLSHTPLGDHARHPPHRAVTPPPPRPKLIEQYSDVADAVPTGRDVTPASPGYAEVEEVCDIKSDESTIKRFQFRQRKQPSVSSSSTTYEDVNPLPTCAANGTVPNSDTRHEQQKKTATTSKSRETPVYVHVVDSPEQISCTTQTTHKQQQLNKDNGSGIAPLAAKFSANAAAKPTDNKSAVDKKGKTGLYSSRLYPLQEGRVASLVSTLDRGQLKKNAKSAAQSNRNSAS
ncbi:hypothetical protein BaRGS_00029795 [Batillaria attramentaria]|uniref:Uncharacterized protein n=1 Tax=Batillaria attramentaria TaxID=370345 RepID=A0ABD0JVM8_9CAEN